MEMNTYPGHPFPLGANWDGNGVNFALYAENAKTVELCLFNSTHAEVEHILLPFAKEPIT